MHRRSAEDEDDEDDDDYESGYEDDSSDEATVPCPYCHRPIHEDAQRCPHCENYISAEDSPPAPKTWFIVLGTILALGVICWWIMH